MREIIKNEVLQIKRIDEEAFLKMSIRAYMQINYHSVRNPGELILCFVVGVDFDERAFILSPVDQELYNKEDFFARIENCSLAKKSEDLKLIPYNPINLSAKPALKPNAKGKHLR